MTISDKLQELIDIKQDIKVAIENKDVDLTGIDFSGYAGKIDEIQTGGGTSIDRIGMICFSFSLSKGSSTTQTLSYDISSQMLSKTFFTDGEGNWYLPADVSVYYSDSYIGSDVYKGKANTSFTLFSGTGTFSGPNVTFKVGTTPVALLLYYYESSSDVSGTGINDEGYIHIGWNTGIGKITPSTYDNNMYFIEVSSDFFDDFPYYSSLDYWKKRNYYNFINPNFQNRISIGWYFIDVD